jgi:hypothetical protein
MVEKKRRFPNLFTPEHIVFRSNLEKVPLVPITVFEDIKGNHAIAHGNHRAYKAYSEGVDIERIVIGTIGKDVSKDENFRPVYALRVIDE